MKTKLNVCSTGALVLLLFVIASPAAAQRFISFDFPGAHGFLLCRGNFQGIDCPGYTNLFFSGIDPVRQMTGGFFSADGSLHGAAVFNGVCTQIDFPGGTSTYANGNNGQGDIVGRYTGPDGVVHGYLKQEIRRVV